MYRFEARQGGPIYFIGSSLWFVGFVFVTIVLLFLYAIPVAVYKSLRNAIIDNYERFKLWRECSTNPENLQY